MTDLKGKISRWQMSNTSDMVLSDLILHNFRNYRRSTFTFSPQTTFIYGTNGSGKSNLLEAVYLLATGGSLRTHTEAEMVNEGSNFSTVLGCLRESDVNVAPIPSWPATTSSSGIYFTNKRPLKMEVTLIKASDSNITGERVRKRFKVGGISRRRSDFLGKLKAVLFNPEQISILNGEPAYRRKYLDLSISQNDPKYVNALLTYEQARTQRNKLLYQIRIGSATVNELGYWEGILSEFGVIVSTARCQFINGVNNYLITNKEKFEKDGYFNLIYQSNIVDRGRFNEYRQREIQAERTLIGPHRDDFYIDFVLGEDQRRNLRRYGSRGQQRLAVFALKMAERRLFEENGATPLFLLDDIFSELDERHREIILSNLDGHQVILTTAEKSVVASLFQNYPVINLS